MRISDRKCFFFFFVRNGGSEVLKDETENKKKKYSTHNDYMRIVIINTQIYIYTCY